MLTRIPEETIESVRSKTDIVELIGEYVQLTKRGKNWFGLCPFHNENSPSFSVSEDKQIFHCFGCGASGNAITFIMDIENSQFVEAIVKLANRTGIEIDANIGNEASRDSKSQHKEMIEAHQMAANFYRHILLNTVEGENALQYLKNRGFSRECIEKYGIGWSLAESNALSDLLQRNDFDMKKMEQAGLVLLKDDGTSYFDRFRERIMFPLHDDTGTIIAFSGRSLSDSKQMAKYLNSPETPIFEKNQILYNFHNARLHVRKTGKVILFEGFMDTISADQIEVPNSVAVMGTSLSDMHLIKLKRIAKQIIICCDGDNAGWEAAKRFAQLAIPKGLDVQVSLLPHNMDPDDYIKEFGGDAFREKIIGNTLSYMSFIMAYAKRSKSLKDENDVLQYIHDVLIELTNRTSPIERDLYIRQLSEETGISVDAIGQQFMKMIASESKQSNNSNQKQFEIRKPVKEFQKKSSSTERAERLLLCHLLNDGALFERIQSEHQDLFIHDEYTILFVHLAGFYEQYGSPDFHRFAETLEDRELRKLALEAAMLERDHSFAEEEIQDCIHHLKKQRIELTIQEKIHESKVAEKGKDHTRALELASEIIQLRKSLMAL